MTEMEINNDENFVSQVTRFYCFLSFSNVKRTFSDTNSNKMMAMKFAIYYMESQVIVEVKIVLFPYSYDHMA